VVPLVAVFVTENAAPAASALPENGRVKLSTTGDHALPSHFST
jgi:hypothetical protein